MKRSPLTSTVHRVTRDERRVYMAVEVRDQGCIVPRVDPEADACQGRITRQHVRFDLGARRVTDEAHVVLCCAWHHLESGWATSKRGMTLQREYLRGLYPNAHGGGEGA